MSQLAERSRSVFVRRHARLHAEPGAADPYGRWTLAVILTVMACQVLFLLVGCNWDFCGDEAEYWAWSRRLDWSYFSRGPLIAWVIRAATEAFGASSLALTGSLMFAARLPAVLLGGLTAWGIFRLASLTTESRRSGMFAAILLPAIPIFAIGGVLITSDTPLVCCWTWAAVWSYRATKSERLGDWIVAGLVGAVGVLAKYSVLAFPASVGLFFLLSPSHRRQLVRPGFWAMSTLCVGLGMVSVLVWNAQHGWAGAGQLADRVGLSDRASWGSIWPILGFLGGEAAVLGGVWWIAGVAAIVAAIRTIVRPGLTESTTGPLPGDSASANRDGTLFLLCLWGVTWSACLAASFLGETEANWMVQGYVAIVVLIGRRFGAVIDLGGKQARAYVAAWCICLVAIVAVHHTDWFYPVVARWVPSPTIRWAAPLRVYDVTARMRGHQELARAVQRRLEALEADGARPFVVTPTYALTSTLSFYLPGQPDTYCLSWNFGMTSRPVNQHDLWHPNPRHDPKAFAGRPFLVVEDANMPPNYATILYHKQVIGRVEQPIERVEVRERGVTVGAWDITVCHDYHGVADYQQNPTDWKAHRKPRKAAEPPSASPTPRG
jgi:4-amino-4-deoxy-L-arabinose transferase-like glycosyltransferase